MLKYKPMAETNTDRLHIPTEITEQLAFAASARGLDFTDERAVRLHDAYLTTSFGNPDLEILPGTFENQGLKIRPAQKIGVGGGILDTAWLDFLPKLLGDEKGSASPRPEKVIPIILQAIDAFQNYIILTDAGIIVKPERFMGNTKPTMAKVAKRIGFEPVPKHSLYIAAAYDTVVDNMFSERVTNIQDMLLQRQSVAPSMGLLAMAT
jgi:hypothetical protein